MHPDGGHVRMKRNLSVWNTKKRGEKAWQFEWFFFSCFPKQINVVLVCVSFVGSLLFECHGFNALTLKLPVLFAFYIYKTITWAHYNWMINDHYSLCSMLTIFFRKFFRIRSIMPFIIMICTDQKCDYIFAFDADNNKIPLPSNRVNWIQFKIQTFEHLNFTLFSIVPNFWSASECILGATCKN